jgi:N4-gp56 family major capsid protein
MTVNLGSGNVGLNYVPTILAQRALELLRATHILPRFATPDTRYETAQFGQTITIPRPMSTTANQKLPGQQVTIQTPTGSNGLQITLNQHWEVTTVIEDTAALLANQSLMDLFVQDAVRSLAEQMEASLFAALNAAVTTNDTDAAAALELSEIRLVRQRLTEARIPVSGRIAVIGPEVETQIKSDTGLANYFAYQQVTIAEGSIGRLEGFDWYVSQLVPVITGTPNKRANFFYHPRGLIVAIRPLPEVPSGMGAVTSTVTDPESGLAMRVVSSYNPNYLGTQITLDMLWGVGVVREYTWRVRTNV